MEHSANGPMTTWDKYKYRDSPPEPMEIPKGYKSPFNDGEVSLNELWMGEKKFLRKFAKPRPHKKTQMDVADMWRGFTIAKETSPE